MSTTSDSRSIWFVDTRGDVLVSAAESGDRLSVVEVSGAHGQMPPLHVHHTDDELFHVIEGELTVYVGDAAERLGAGDTGFAPRGVPHTYRVESDGGRWLAVGSPGGLDRYFMAIGQPAADAGLPPEPIAPDEAAAAALERETGFRIELLGPPGALPSDLGER
jgi:quercetin dioxygenase-like cupin family protein